MNEDQKRRGRPPKTHLQDDHHFKPAGEEFFADEAILSDPSDGTPIAIPESVEAIVENPIVIPVSSPLEQEFGQTIITETEYAGLVTTSALDESLIEQKIHNPVEERANLSGWHPIDTEIVLQIPPRNGMPVRLSETLEGEGILAFWKKTRKFANTTHRWAESGKWVNFDTGLDISFQPQYWKERY